MRTMTNFLSFLFGVLALYSCGKNSGESSSRSSDAREEEEIIREGNQTYLATLRPLNNIVAGYIPSGQTEVRIIGKNIQFKTQLEDDASVIHVQNLHAGSTCPTASDDVNGDGFIDEVEMVSSTGQVLVPMDSNLSSLKEGTFNRGGPLFYSSTTKLADLINELYRASLIPTIDSLSLEGKVVMVHGVSANAILPGTVASASGRAINLSLPMACGVLRFSP